MNETDLTRLETVVNQKKKIEISNRPIQAIRNRRLRLMETGGAKNAAKATYESTARRLT